MKTLFIPILILLQVFICKAQIIFEHDYDSASTYAGGSQYAVSQLMIVKFEVSGERYVNYNRWGRYMSIYDLNHSLLKKIDLSSLPYNPSMINYHVILYLSEQLFDTDPGIEFMYVMDATLPTQCYTGIYNDDGSLIFSDTAAPLIYQSFPSQQYPIYNTTQGTKMLLSYSNGHAKVFSLPGTLSMGIQEGNAQLMQAQGGQLNNLYPNPSTGTVTLQYELPKGETQGELILYNPQGAEVKRYKVDNTFNTLLLDNTMLPAGVYFYQLTTSKGAVGSKKMVVIK